MLPLASSIRESSTDKLSVLTVVVVPLTVKSPPTIKLLCVVTTPVTFNVLSKEAAPVTSSVPATSTSSAKLIVCAIVSPVVAPVVCKFEPTAIVAN